MNKDHKLNDLEEGHPSEDCQQEVLIIVENLRQKYPLVGDDVLFQKGILLYEKGIRSYMFLEQDYRERIFLDEIVEYLMISENREDIKQYEIKRSSRVTNGMNDQVILSSNSHVIPMSSYLEKKRLRDKK